MVKEMNTISRICPFPLKIYEHDMQHLIDNGLIIKRKLCINGRIRFLGFERAFT